MTNYKNNNCCTNQISLNVIYDINYNFFYSSYKKKTRLKTNLGKVTNLI